MNQPAKIKLFLVNGMPNGLRTAELSNWSGEAVSVLRSELTQLFARPELRLQGNDFLTGGNRNGQLAWRQPIGWRSKWFEWRSE